MHLTKKPLHTYGSQFFSVGAAQVILPEVFSMLQPRTVVDVGCGIGTWASVAKSLGSEIKGLDGPHVPVDQRLIAAAEFIETDLMSFKGIGRFDLAICLEVVEHLPASHADQIVAGLCESAEVILFSAAIPLQGGENHINEQWPTYWQTKFAAQDFVMLDVFRERFWNDPDVDWWYRQNLFLVCRNGHPLTESSKPFQGDCYVHPELYLQKARGLAKERRGLRRILNAFRI